MDRAHISSLPRSFWNYWINFGGWGDGKEKLLLYQRNQKGSRQRTRDLEVIPGGRKTEHKWNAIDWGDKIENPSPNRSGKNGRSHMMIITERTAFGIAKPACHVFQSPAAICTACWCPGLRCSDSRESSPNKGGSSPGGGLGDDVRAWEGRRACSNTDPAYEAVKSQREANDKTINISTQALASPCRIRLSSFGHSGAFYLSMESVKAKPRREVISKVLLDLGCCRKSALGRQAKN